MKIGILTFWVTLENYGQILQLYALYTFLKRNGHDPFVINYDGYGDSALKQSFFRRFLNAIKKPKKIISYLRMNLKEMKTTKKIKMHDCNFNSFKCENFVFSEKYYSFDELRKNPPAAGAYICGSDMIWAENSKYRAFFLDFGKTGTKKIAYAPSFGSSKISNEYKKVIKPLLESFEFISVREENGTNICKELGFPNTMWAPDPTALLCDADYLSLCENTNSEKHLFMYLLGHQTNIPFKDIYSFAEEKKIEVIYSAIQGRFDSYPKSYLSIQEWLRNISSSDYVVTNSFHGCMFSVIFRKKFLYLPLVNKSKSINERVFSLLKKLGLESRIWKGDFSIIDMEIDYQKVMNVLTEWVEKTKKQLLNVLG